MPEHDKLLLIDVYSMVYRAFFALPPLTTSSGRPINAAYGFQRMINRMLNEEKPSHVVACFDAGVPAERLAAVPEYKAQRPDMPDDLRPQFDIVRKILSAYGIAVVEIEGEEADDCIATIVSLANQRQLECMVVSGDLDLLQLVGPHCTVVVTRRGISELARYDQVAVRERYGLAPEQLADFRGLKGDPSDNLPGVPGVGEKTAARLIAQFGSLDALLENTESVTPKRIAELLRAHADKARACRDVSTAKRDLGIAADWQGWRYHEPSSQQLADLFRELEFRSLLSKVTTPAFEGIAGGGFQDEPAQFEAGSYRVLEQPDEIVAALHAAGRAPSVAIVTAPPIASWRLDSPAAFMFSWLPKEAVVVATKDLLENAAAREALDALLRSPSVAKTVFDAKNLDGWLATQGLTLEGLGLDAMLAAGILDPAHGEPSLQQALAGTPGEGAARRAPVDGKAASFEAGPGAESGWGAAADALARSASSRLDGVRQAGLERVLLEIEQPLSPLLAKMEAAGFGLDVQELDRIRTSLERTIEETTRDIYRLAGEEFNLNSPKVLGVVLFEKLGLPAGSRKKKSGYGTGAEVLMPLAMEHEIAAKLLQYREVSKLKSTYVDSLPALVDPRTRRLHTTLHQLGAATGRISSSNPNLQNIPVRSEAGRAIRRAFLPPTPGNLLLAADYSQIELRIFAHLSHDENFIQAFRRGDDIHDFTARAVFGETSQQPVSSDLRRRAKAVNFGILYGISDVGLAHSAGMTRSEAKEFIADYFARFPKIKSYIDGTLQAAHHDGFVTTLFGRRRYLPDLRSRVYPQRAAAERMAINAPAQGTAADLIKLAMVAVDRALRDAGLHARLLLQVHDELIFDVVEHEVAAVGQVVKQSMEGAMQLSVPLVVDVKVGPNWAQAQPLDE